MTDRPAQPEQTPNDENKDQDANDDSMNRTFIDPAPNVPSSDNKDDMFATMVDTPKQDQDTATLGSFTFDDDDDTPAPPQQPSAPSVPSTPTPTPTAQDGKAEKPAKFDPYATSFEQPVDPSMYQTMAPGAIPTQDPAPQQPSAATPKPIDTQQSGTEPSSSEEQHPLQGIFNQVQNQMQGPSVFTNMNSIPLTAIYTAKVLLSALGLALVARFLVLLLIYGDFSFGRLVLALLGVGLAIGFYIAFEYIPILAGAQARMDTLDLQQDQSLSSIGEPGAVPNPWYIGLAVMLTVTGLLGGGLIFDFWEFVDGVSQLSAIILGGIGGALVGGLSAFKEPRLPLGNSSERRFKPLQLLRPLAIGFGLIFLAASLQLVRVSTDVETDDGQFRVVPAPYSEDVPIYFLLALIGMYGIAGQSLRVLPLRAHRIFGATMVGLMAGVGAVAFMSILTMLLDPISVGEETARFAYSPAYLISTMEDSLLPLMSLFGILLASAGLSAGFLTMQSFDENLIGNKTKRTQTLGLTTVTLFAVMLPMVVIFPLLTLLPLGFFLEAWLLFLIPFALLMGLLWVTKARIGFAPAVLKGLSGLIKRIPSTVPSWVTKPLQDFTATDATTIQSFLTWQRGFIFVVVFAAIAPALALSFWFWILAFVGVLYLIGPKSASTGTPAPRRPSPLATKPTEQTEPQATPKQNTGNVPTAPDEKPKQSGPFTLE